MVFLSSVVWQMGGVLKIGGTLLRLACNVNGDAGARH